MIVARDGSGDFKTIQEAIDSIPKENTSPITIHIKPGVYKEKLHIEVPFITLKGEDPVSTLITYNDYAEKYLPNGEQYGTFRSYTAFIGAPNSTFENLTFENSSGFGSVVGQALAVYADADRIFFKNCRLLGHQDTLFTGPLPPAPIKPGSFKGPRENDERIIGRQYYEDCYIEGEVDFIFGSATAYFYNCEIFSHNRNEEVNGYVTAPSTPEGQKYGYVFEKCRLTSNCAPQTVYLGRPWRNFAKTVFINCDIASHIKAEGWHNWNKEEANTQSFFAEYHNTGMGADLSKRVSFSHVLTDNQAIDYTREAVLSGDDNWTPWQ